MVDTISSLGSIDYRHDEWGVDVTVGCSQKGLMLPPGLGLQRDQRQGAAPRRKRRGCRARTGTGSRCSRDNAAGFFPYTPATNLLFGLREALQMLDEEGLPNVFARHRRYGEATRRAVRAWGLELLCRRSARIQRLADRGDDADGSRRGRVSRRRCSSSFDMSLGTGLGKLKGRVFRIGHLGDFNDLMLAGTLCGVEMGLAASGVPFTPRRHDGRAGISRYPGLACVVAGYDTMPSRRSATISSGEKPVSRENLVGVLAEQRRTSRRVAACRSS